MSLKSEALGLLRFLEDRIRNLPSVKESDWIESTAVAQASGVDVGNLKKVLRRPRVKTLLDKAAIGCSHRGAFVYVYRKPGFGNTTIGESDIPDDADDISFGDATGPVEPTGLAADDWSLDPGYYWLPPVAADIEIAIDAGKNIFAIGPAGCGKSSLLERIFLNRGVKPMLISFHGEVSVDDLVGGKDLVNGQTVFTEGILPTCMRKGIPLIIDEADATPPDVQFILHPVLMGQPLLLSRKGAEYVNPEQGFVIAATGNTIGRGDDSGLYVGTNVLNEAYLDRYGMVFEHWYMPQLEEVKVLVRRTGTHRRVAEKMVDVAQLARDAMIADRLSSTFSTRKLLDWCDLTVHGMDMGRAFVYSCISKVSREDRRVIAEFGQRVFGGTLGIDPSKY